MLAGGIVCIILALPLLLIGFFGTIGSLPEDPGTAIVMGIIFGAPGIILMVIGVRLIRKSQIEAQIKYEQMMGQRNWNKVNNNPNANYRYPPQQTNSSSTTVQFTSQQSSSYTINNPLDPRTAMYRNRQQQGGAPSPNPNPAPASAGVKTIDCPSCGASQTLAPQQSRECEYCGTVVAYR